VTDLVNIGGLRLLAPELIIILTGLFLLLLDLMVQRKEAVAIAGIVGLLVSAYVNLGLMSMGLEGDTLQGMIVYDSYANFFRIIFYVNLFLTIFISLRYMAVEGSGSGEYYSLLFFATGGMMIMTGATDLIVLYLGLELMALSTYVLVGILRRQPRANEAAIKYFFLGAFSSAFLLYGIALVFGLTGSTNLTDVASGLNSLGLTGHPMTLLALSFFVVAFGFKIALAPFHMWAPDVYEGAPTSVTAFMSIGPKAAGFAVIGRVFFDAFGELQIDWSRIFMVLSVLTIALGSILALSQTNIKRMLAYSSIAHAGYALIGILAGTSDGLISTMSYLMIYAFMNMGAFAVVISLRREGVAGEELRDYAGLARSHPLSAALMLIFMFSLTGIPPTAGFVGKFYVFMEAIYAGYLPVVIIAAIFSVVSAFFYLRVVMYMYMKEPEGEVELFISRPMGISLAVTAFMVLLLGVYPAILLDLARTSILW
jgi:NADH-quinone oxidoreductase subunit N